MYLVPFRFIAIYLDIYVHRNMKTPTEIEKTIVRTEEFIGSTKYLDYLLSIGNKSIFQEYERELQLIQKQVQFVSNSPFERYCIAMLLLEMSFNHNQWRSEELSYKKLNPQRQDGANSLLKILEAFESNLC